MPTIEEIKAIIASIEPIECYGNQVASGSLSSTRGQKIDYQLMLGWDIVLANRCDETWGTFNIRLLQHIYDQKLEVEALAETLSKIQIDDSHWRWLNKSILFKSDEYKWFFILSEGYPQAACLIYHPKPSAIDGQGIFYIEFIAVAPWNRENPMAERSFKGVGKTMIDEVSSYARNNLGLRPGFSLHALPKAVGFYQAIGMQHIANYDKNNLPYFEMPKDHYSAKEVTT